MNYAKLSTSARLQRALRYMQKVKRPVTALEMVRKARVTAVSSVMAELRFNGAEIQCAKKYENGAFRWYYTLLKSPEGW